MAVSRNDIPFPFSVRVGVGVRVRVKVGVRVGVKRNDVPFPLSVDFRLDTLERQKLLRAHAEAAKWEGLP